MRSEQEYILSVRNSVSKYCEVIEKSKSERKSRRVDVFQKDFG
jgi:hypothetical protein